MLIISTLIFLGSIFNIHLKVIYEYSFIQGLIISLFSLISIFLSLNLFYKTNSEPLNINKILLIFFIKIFILILLFSNGIIGNPNNDFKNFINQSELEKIIKNNQIFIIGELDDKNLNLFQFYIPNSKLITTSEIPKTKSIYGIISKNDIIKLKYSNSRKLINLKKFQDINFIKIN